MGTKIKKGSKVLIVEGPEIGYKGIVTQLLRIFDEDSKVMRWTVWVDSRIKTRLNWVREI